MITIKLPQILMFIAGGMGIVGVVICPDYPKWASISWICLAVLWSLFAK